MPKRAAPFLRSFLRSGLAGFALVAVLAACGGDKSGGPSGPPGDVVGRAPDVTLSARTAQIFITAPTANARGSVDFAAHEGRLSVLAAGDPKPADLLIVGGTGYVKASNDRSYAALDGPLPQAIRGGDPWTAVDLVRGTVHILSNGGGEIDGASTIGYTITVDPQQAIETTPAPRQAALEALLAGRTAPFTMDIWIDSRLRLRRIEVPADFSFKSTTPPTRVDGATIATDVDFVTFGVSVPTVAPPVPS
jgi:hypothetical protein